MLKIGNKIRELRKKKEITLIEFSKMTGVAQATLSRIETGDMPGTIECHHKILKGRAGRTSVAEKEDKVRFGPARLVMPPCTPGTGTGAWAGRRRRRQCP